MNNLAKFPFMSPIKPVAAPLTPKMSLSDQLAEAERLIKLLIEEGMQGNANNVSAKDYQTTKALLEAIYKNPQLNSLGSNAAQDIKNALDTLEQGFASSDRSGKPWMSHTALEKVLNYIQNLEE